MKWSLPQACRAFALTNLSLVIAIGGIAVGLLSSGLAVGAEDAPAFDTGVLKGNFRFFSLEGQRALWQSFPGVGECVYVPLQVPLLNKATPNALLMPEWVLQTKSSPNIVLFQRAAFIHPEPIEGGVRVQYPDEALAPSGFRCTLEYRVRADMILLDGYIEATRDHEDVELVFASYIPNRLDATYVPLRTDEGVTWQLLPRKTPWKSAYFITSSAETMLWVHDGRWGDASQLGDWSEVFEGKQPFAAPILVAVEEETGLAVVTFVDDHCTQLLGQHHPNDTAHDFCWGWPTLRSGEKVHTRAALWVGELRGTHAERMQQVFERYREWKQSFGADAPAGSTPE